MTTRRNVLLLLGLLAVPGLVASMAIIHGSDAPGDSSGEDDLAVPPETNRAILGSSLLRGTPSWSIVATDLTELGAAVGSAGDVNRDGYDDIIVGAPRSDRAFVYHGSSAGPSFAPDWLIQVDHSRLGHSLGTAGDVNGDGYDDVIVGAPLFDSLYVDQGRAYVYLGGPAGLSHPWAWTADGTQLRERFGWSVGAAGDVNGDGFDDVIVGACFAEVGMVNGGLAQVFLGSATGPEPTPVWSFAGNDPDGCLGDAVGTAGDVNGDGFDDIVVGESGYSGDHSAEGRALVFHGSPAGPSTSPDWTVESDQDNAGLGSGVGTAGDVNDDGFDDVLVGASKFTNGELNEGAAWVYLGSSGGLSSNPHWSVEGDLANLNFGGTGGGVGDVDRDGLVDLLVGGSILDSSDPVRARLYLGTSGGLETTSVWEALDPSSANRVGGALAFAGDVNGDRHADIIVGQENYDGKGAVFVYFGGECVDADVDGLCREDDCDDANPYCTTDCTDADDDGYCVTSDCDDSNSSCTSDCTDADDDGYCVNGDCSDTNPNCTTDCTDADDDGWCITTDCDESRPFCTMDCTDSDGDGYCVTNDCDDTTPTCSWQCGDNDADGVLDCSDNCPQIANPDQGNLDGDGWGDACDPCPPIPGAGVDTDGDGSCDDASVCPSNLSGAISIGEVAAYEVSRDGLRTVYSADATGSYELYSVPTTGGSPIRLHDDLVPGTNVGWWAIAGETGGVVVEANQQTGGSDLYSVPLLGGATTSLMASQEMSWESDTLHMMADGFHVIADCGGPATATTWGLCKIPTQGPETVDYLVQNWPNDWVSISNLAYDPSGRSVAYTLRDSSPDGFHALVRKMLHGPGSGFWEQSLSATGFVFSDEGNWVLLELDMPWAVAGLAVSRLDLSPRAVGPPDWYGNLLGFDITPVPVGGAERVLAVYDADDPLDEGLIQLPVYGGTELRLTTDLPSEFEISSDGERVVYLDAAVIRSVPVLGGSPPVDLNPSGDVEEFLLSPDGAWVVYRADQDTPGVLELYAVPTEGGSPVKLNGSLVAGGQVSTTYLVTPDSSTVVYRADQQQAGRPELFAVPITGGVPRKLNGELPPGGSVAEDVTVTADSGLVLYRADESQQAHFELYLAALETDGDAVLTSCDCAPLNDQLWALPGEVAQLRLTHAGGVGGTTTLSWSVPPTPGGTLVHYDVLRGEAPDDSSVFETVAAGESGTSTTDDDDPSPVYYYLVRATNDCGDGPLGR
jgi:hypothetical protein